jgi:predicted amidophosphoribosyltransferase
MAIRDHFRVDLLARKAARLQEVDAELGAVERLARIDGGGAAGACPNCDALYPRGARYCSQCAHPLMGRSE